MNILLGASLGFTAGIAAALLAIPRTHWNLCREDCARLDYGSYLERIRTGEPLQKEAAP